MANQNEEAIKNEGYVNEIQIVDSEQTEAKSFDFAHYAPTIATIFFFLTFCYIIYAVFKKGTTKKFDKYSQIPLKDDKPKQ